MSYNRPQMPLPGQEQQQLQQPAKEHHHLLGKLMSKFENLKVDSQKTQPQQTHHAPAQSTPIQSFASSGSDADYDNAVFSTPISNDDPASYFGTATHPVPVNHIIQNSSGPIETNKFYGNMLLTDQTNTIWTNPYSLIFSKVDYFGLGVCYIEDSQKVYGEGNPAEYFLNPIGIKSMIFSAKEFNGDNMKLTLSDPKQFSVMAKVGISGHESIDTPLVQGMGVITGIYNNLTIDFNSIVGFRDFEEVRTFNNIKKYRVTLFNNITWTIYISDYRGSFQLTKVDNNHITSNTKVTKATVQICCGYSDYYDKVAGTYTTSFELKAKQLSPASGKFCFKFNYQGNSQINKPLMWAYPHHVESFTSYMDSGKTDLVLQSAVCGKMRAYISDKFEFFENDLPTNINFEPWSSLKSFDSSKNFFSNNKLMNKINAALDVEVNDDIEGFCNLDSMYFGGKQLDKYAYLLYVAHYVAKDSNKTNTIMTKLKNAFQKYIVNKQINPLVYDTTFKGLVSTAGNFTDLNQDFGNPAYNDHHFHYGYHVHAAAILGKIDQELGGNWLKENAKYINFLIRDFANPSSSSDSSFPEFRSFDWYTGHSWAKGLFPSSDGKDQESSSEDYHAYYGLKLWGQVINNPTLTFRACLQLAILKRVCLNYIYMKDSNQNLPKKFIGNKVPGIIFENKMHHATYFGANLEYIQGIHMIPLTPISGYFRDEEFVREEWNQLLKDHVNTVNDGWKGLLMLNTVLMDPKFAWNFFSQDSFNRGWLDGGMSLSWSLALIGGVGGAE